MRKRNRFGFGNENSLQIGIVVSLVIAIAIGIYMYTKKSKPVTTPSIKPSTTPVTTPSTTLSSTPSSIIIPIPIITNDKTDAITIGVDDEKLTNKSIDIPIGYRTFSKLSCTYTVVISGDKIPQFSIIANGNVIVSTALINETENDKNAKTVTTTINLSPSVTASSLTISVTPDISTVVRLTKGSITLTK